MSVGHGRLGIEVRCSVCRIRDDAFESGLSTLKAPTFLSSRGSWFCSVEHMRDIGERAHVRERQLSYCSEQDCYVKVLMTHEKCARHR